MYLSALNIQVLINIDVHLYASEMCQNILGILMNFQETRDSKGGLSTYYVILL